MGLATFIENDYGTQTAKAVVYNTWWFELIMVIFVVNFIGNIPKYKLWRKEKISLLLVHLSFILIILGAGITRYIGYEGLMPIREGEKSNLMLSEKTYLTLDINDGKEQMDTIYRNYLFAKDPHTKGFMPSVTRALNFIRGGNDFSVKTNFRGKAVEVNYVNYIPNAYQRFEPASNAPDTFLHLVESGGGGRHDHYIRQGEIVNIHNILVAFENRTPGAINIYKDNDTLRIATPYEGNYMIMTTQQFIPVKADTVQEFHLRSLYNLQGFQFVVPTPPAKGKLVTTSGDKDQYRADMLEVQVKSGDQAQNVVLYGGQYMINPPKELSLNGLNFRINYGAMQWQLPFSIKLRDFQLERYPGSMSPKSYASEVTVMDHNTNFDFRIFMNNVLDYRGYRFFQSGYDNSGRVEETRLSVNHDVAGTWFTYIGYSLLYTGLIMILFSKTTRFADLRRKLTEVKTKSAALTILAALVTTLSFSQQPAHTHSISDAQVDSILSAQKVPEDMATSFGSLIIQDEGGRMKPVNTFTSELLRKVSKHDNYNGLDANQVAVSMVTNPRLWLSVPFIYINPNNTKLRDIIGIPEDQKYARFTDFFSGTGTYKLGPDVEQASKKRIKTKYEQSVVSVNERVNLLYQAIMGNIFKFFPLEGDENNKWHSALETQSAGYKGTDSLFVATIIPLYSQALQKAKQDHNYGEANEFLESMHKYQHKFGNAVMPSDQKVKLELFYNKYDIFKGLFWQYMLASVLLFLFVITQIFNRSKLVDLLVKIGSAIILLLFVYHTLGLAVRWYISGHAPWSNAYESMIYVAWSTMLFGLIFGRKSALTIAATAFVTSMLLMIAHWNWMDPSISNLVPVLDSYWLMIHVAIIVASYGPFTLSMILGSIALILMFVMNEKNKKRLKLAIEEVTIINEMSMTVGLVMLTIGNFLGGMWANESWGRYWGWDPKETWALVSIMVYAFVTHMRLVPGLRGRLAFNIAAVFAFASILMTYLGVNHLLSGLHSYAAGESAPIPVQIWMWLGFSALISILAYFRYKQFYK